MKTKFQLKIIDFLKQQRIKNEFSQQKVGEILGISNGQVGSIESPKFAQKYTLAQILTLCNEYHIPIEQLFLSDEDFLTSQDIIKKLVEKIVEYEN